MLPIDPLLRARIRGARVSTNVSTPIVICLTAAGLVAGLEPGATPTSTWLPGAAVVIITLLAAIGLMTVSQVMAIRSMGIAVRQVHVLVFGSIIHKGRSPNGPRVGTIVGASSMIALLTIPGAIALLVLLRDLGNGERVVPTAVAITLGGIVLLQLMPGLGLSGGYLLQSLVWYLTESAVIGSRVAATYAFLIGGALMATGVGSIGLSGSRPYLGIWAVVAGWQLSGVARMEVARTRWHAQASTSTLADLLQPTARIREDAPIDHAIDLLVASGSDGYVMVVGDEGRPVGILRLENLRAVRRSEWHRIPLSTISTSLTDLPHLAADTRVIDAIYALDGADAEIVVVAELTDTRRPIGALSRATLTRRLPNRLP